MPGSDEQRPAPPDEDLQHVITIYEMTLQAVIEETDDPDLKEYFERTLANTARFLFESAAERAAAPAPESLPVGTDQCATCSDVGYTLFRGFENLCNDCEKGRALARKGALHPDDWLPVGTDSARAEAERRYPVRFDGQMTARVSEPRRAFIAGAEWARAEERAARVSLEAAAQALHTADKAVLAYIDTQQHNWSQKRYEALCDARDHAMTPIVEWVEERALAGASTPAPVPEDGTGGAE